MPWLDVPHQQQANPSWCLPACVAMVAAYWQQPLLQADIAHWLGSTAVGVPASRVQRLGSRGFTVIYRTGSLADLESWILKGKPCILFVRTGELTYWQMDTAHAIVLAGFDAEEAILIDPAMTLAAIRVPIGELMLAWSYFDYAYAVLYVDDGGD